MNGRHLIVILTVALAIVALFSSPSWAYIGPGAGLTAIGSLLALFAAIAVTIIGFIWFPLKRLLRKRKKVAAEKATTGGEDG